VPLFSKVRNDNTLIDEGFNPIRHIQGLSSTTIYKNVVNGASPKRLVASARRTFPLQKAGLVELVACGRDMSKMAAYGTDESYCLKHSWASDCLMETLIDGKLSRKEGESESEDGSTNDILNNENETGSVAHSRKCVQDIFKNYLIQPPAATGGANVNTALTDLDEGMFNFRTWRWARKRPQESTWLDPFPNSIGTTFGASSLFSDGEVTTRLLNLGMAPICQFHKPKGGVINVLFGPSVDHTKNNNLSPLVGGSLHEASMPSTASSLMTFTVRPGQEMRVDLTL
jgi:hypothetical protein